MQLNIDQLKSDACKVLALISLIEKSQTKALTIATSSFYKVFGSTEQMQAAVKSQNAVTQRLAGYLARLTERRAG